MIGEPPPRTPTWLGYALKEQGVCEVPGEGDNPRILEYHATTLRTRLKRWFADRTPWCSSFVNWSFLQAGIAGTSNPSAKSWESWGIACEPKRGAVLVFKRGLPWQRHVAFYVGESTSHYRVFGGNQHDRVGYESRSKELCTACRWPG